jgi:hypothetical protein
MAGTCRVKHAVAEAEPDQAEGGKPGRRALDVPNGHRHRTVILLLLEQDEAGWIGQDRRRCRRVARPDQELARIDPRLDRRRRRRRCRQQWRFGPQGGVGQDQQQRQPRKQRGNPTAP